MKKIQMLIVLAVLLTFGLSQQAFATPVLDMGNNTLYFQGLEAGYNTTYGAVTLGTVFAGILKVKEIEGNGGSTIYTSGAAEGYLTGIFLAQVTAYDAATNTYTLSAFDPTYNTAAWNLLPTEFQTLFGANTTDSVIKLYFSMTDPGVSSASTPAVVTTVASGTLWADFALGAGDSMETIITGDPATGNIFANLNLDLTEIFGVDADSLHASIGLTNNSINSATWLIRLGDSGDVYATPEPATMLIMGTGLLGLFGMRRRQKNAA
jgi:hypothetical protein